MRVFILLASFITILLSDAKLVSNIDKTLQKVMNESREKKINSIKVDYDPFNTIKEKPIIKNTKKSKAVKVKQKIESKKPTLSMIFNKKAFINGKWYKQNDKFADYVVTKIDKDIVILKKKNRYTTLKLSTSNQIIITKKEMP